MASARREAEVFQMELLHFCVLEIWQPVELKTQHGRLIPLREENKMIEMESKLRELNLQIDQEKDSQRRLVSPKKPPELIN